MNESPKCPVCGAPHTPQDLARKLRTSAVAVMEGEAEPERAHVYVPAAELKAVCELVLDPPPQPATSPETDLKT